MTSITDSSAPRPVTVGQVPPRTVAGPRRWTAGSRRPRWVLRPIDATVNQL